MICFDLKCSHDHVFEAWFRSSGDFEDQAKRGLIECPHCADTKVAKAIMAPNVGVKTNQRSDRSAPTAPVETVPSANPAGEMSEASPKSAGGNPAALSGPVPAQTRAQLVALAKALKTEVEKTCDNVGKDFPEEARKIHYGEAESRGIYGEAKPEEVRDLLDEGIDLLPLPEMTKDIQ